MQFHSWRAEEKPIRCLLLIAEDNAVARCDQPTSQAKYPFCYDCFSDLPRDAQDDVFSEWSRDPLSHKERLVLALDENCYRWLNDSELIAYNQRVALPEGTFEAIDVVVRPPRATWREGDARHQGPFTVYVIRLGDGSYYVGQTRKNAKTRYEEHKERGSRSAAVCKARGVEKLVFQTSVRSRRIAQEVEQFTHQLLRQTGLRATIGEDPDE